MKTRAGLLLFLLCLCVPFYAVAEDRLEAEPEINTLLMNATFKMEGRGARGTAFIMGIPAVSGGDRLEYVLMTAAHVLEQMRGDQATLLLRRRVGGRYARLPLVIPIRKDKKPLWVRNPSVDIAAMPVWIPKDIHMQYISPSLLADDRELKAWQIHPGDELFCLGFPHGIDANGLGFPILRSGRIASYPLLPTREVKTFLLDLEVLPGNSGSPVYLYQTNRIYGGKAHVNERLQCLMGIIGQRKGFLEIKPTEGGFASRMNSLGVAVVIHASFIRETLDLLKGFEKETK
jgi:hypothetical protein